MRAVGMHRTFKSACYTGYSLLKGKTHTISTTPYL